MAGDGGLPEDLHMGPSTDEAICDLETFYFVALEFLSMGGRHSKSVTDILYPIERLDELHIKVKEMITSPHLATTLLFNI